MTSTLKSQALTTLFLSLMATLPVQAASRVVVNGDFENMGSMPYNARPDALTQVSFATGYGWQATDIKRKIEVWHNYVDGSVSGFQFSGYGGRGFFVETNANSAGFLYQPVCLRKGESIEAKFAHRARKTAGERVQYAIYKDFGNTLAFKFGDYAATGNRIWDYHVTGSQIYQGESGVFNLGFKSLDPRVYW
jgi:hypothetical protein